MDENKEIVNEDKFATEGQAKAAVIILVIIFIAAMVMIILMLDRRNARAIEQEKILQDELDEANERRGDLLAEAEELFLKRLKDNTENDITQLDAVLYGIG
jgi:flagellar biosynthesis/type III secretory pathway M-ring protein FliF/YscJ